MIVLDASVIIKLINPNENAAEIAVMLYKKHLSNEENIMLPQLCFIEVANFLATKSSTVQKDIKEGIQFLYASNFTIAETTENDLLEATSFAKQYKTSVYDMIYAITAQKNNGMLVTADEKFINKVDFPFIKSITALAEKT